ncbi:hypothetical protein SAMN03080617_02379 [Algoriphagus alkaliphilus]|uniref:Lipocalin-like domain-containing protein n=1 Tax=Algoriphagus alkaliphilus TaxID=279824 RepID=A0A1G5YAK5_9BACT|nr:hypothetical protein [Algoriphagus alkaliphilus]SDA79709.1 hypothetical protein SAMN03080617_02379 [Algoriphagus alkaliphilus]
MRYLVLLILISFSLTGFAQEPTQVDTLSKGEQKMLGIWKLDLPNQKVEGPSAKKFKSDEEGQIEEKKFWKKNESWICHLREDKTYLKAWVENGTLQEEEGTWSFDESVMVLVLVFKEESNTYEITYREKGQLWKPLRKEKEEFNVLFVKRLGS